MSYKRLVGVIFLSALFAWYVDRVLYKDYDEIVEEKFLITERNRLLEKDIKSLLFEHKALSAEVARLKAEDCKVVVDDGRYPEKSVLRASEIPYHVPVDIQQPLPYEY